MICDLSTQQVSMCKVSALIESYHQFIPFSNRASAREAESQVEFLFNDSRVVFFRLLGHAQARP